MENGVGGSSLRRYELKRDKKLVYLIRGARRREKANGIEKAGVYQYFFKMISSAILLMFNV